MSTRDFEVLSHLTYDEAGYEPGSSISLPADVAAPLIEDGVLADPDAPRREAPAGDFAAILDRAVEALRQAPADEVRAFLERCADDDEIRAKVESAVDRHQLLVDAIDDLEPGKEEHWTGEGKPEVRALAKESGLQHVTAAERDAAWAAHQAREGGGDDEG